MMITPQRGFDKMFFLHFLCKISVQIPVMLVTQQPRAVVMAAQVMWREILAMLFKFAALQQHWTTAPGTHRSSKGWPALQGGKRQFCRRKSDHVV